ncbi:hypothetical protein [Sporosarcina sp. Te-1]|uniref:hypothetical protein n=1 Tax=Sporosarcina sp. Te-1 TaxID=2818390 RepID=UPI001A9F6A23|nr:hypothetical protein [Sporosarcina sp. Te-1]QTD40786.1 hypothetical protein J3U78_18860 [Sporosarcina sp. Te-1]
MESFVLYVHDLQAHLYWRKKKDAYIQEWIIPYANRARHLQSIKIDLETNHIIIEKKTDAPFDMNKRIVDCLTEMNIGFKPRQMTLFLDKPPSQKTIVRI